MGHTSGLLPAMALGVCLRGNARAECVRLLPVTFSVCACWRFEYNYKLVKIDIR